MPESYIALMHLCIKPGSSKKQHWRQGDPLFHTLGSQTGALGFDMRQALQLEPGDPVLYSNRSLCHLRLKAHSEARTQRLHDCSTLCSCAVPQNLVLCCQ